MKKHIRILALWLILGMLLPMAAVAQPAADGAEPEFAAAQIGGLVDKLRGDTDNYDLEVDIVWQKSNKKRVIYSGKLGGYAFGLYRYIDFTGVAYQVIFSTLGITDDVIYIVPKGEKPIEEVMDSLTPENGAEPTAPSGAGSLKCEVNLMYDGIYHERILIQDKVLAVPIRITNTGSRAGQAVCFIGEYMADGRLLHMVDYTPISIGSNQAITTTVLHGFDANAEFAKIFMFENGTLRPLTNAIHLTEQAVDYYANSFSNAQEYDMIYPIEGNIDTIGDVDYIKFIPQSSGTHTFDCISANGVLTTLYNASQSALKSNAASYQYSLTKGQTYYVGIRASNQTGGYVLRIQPKAAETDGFDVYAFDVAANRMKTMITDQCENLYYDAIDTSKEVYNALQQLIMEDFRLHRLPEFLQNSDKNINDYDTLVNAYLSLKSADFTALFEKYEALLTKANDYADAYTNNERQLPETEKVDCPVAAAKSPLLQLDETGMLMGEAAPDPDMEFEVTAETIDIEAADDRANPSDRYLVIQETGVLGIDFKVRFPDSSPLNTVYLYNFNEKDGITTWKPVWGTVKDPKLDVANGTYSIRGLVPGGIYIVHAMWADRFSSTYGEENSIHRWVQLPYDTEETLETIQKKHVSASFEPTGVLNLSRSNIKHWLDQMDEVYETLQEFTGYTPYNGKPITIRSSREDFSGNQPDGENYWRLIMGWSGNPIKISQPFYQSHLRRLSRGDVDWGDTPIHELSHDFDNDKWIFDHETLAFLKLAYVLEKHNASVYRIDTQKYYKGKNYATFLKTDWFEGYSESFAKGFYQPAGLASILLDIKNNIGWDAFSKTFHHIGELSWSQIPDSELGKLNLFLTCLGQYSGKNVFSMMSSRDKGILAEEFGGAIEAYTPPVAEMPDGSAGRRVDISVQKGDYKQYQFVPYKTGNYRIYTSPYGDTGVPNDTYIEVYDENTETGRPIATNDDDGKSKFSRVDLNLTQGRAYYIKVYNYNQDNGRLHARLHIMSNDTAVKLSLDTPQNVTASYTEFKMFQFTPGKTGTYVFCADGYNGGQQTYDTYLKLYAEEGLQSMIGQNADKIVAHLAAGHTYYLQFSGYLMKYARARITVRQGQTIEFTKRTDSSFIYVNSPEYLTRIDMVDDECHIRPVSDKIGIQPYMKIFEQENITGKNTFYETHLAWWGEQGEDYNPRSAFYLDVDLYNPTANPVSVSIKNLAYGTNYSILQQYYNGGYGFDVTIAPYSHVPLLSHIGAPLLCAELVGDEWARTPVILFDFTVHSGNVTVSSLAAYNPNNLYLRNGMKNIVDKMSVELNSGEILYDFDENGNVAWGDSPNNPRPNETDLYIKMKGIARNESAWIDANIDLAIDNTTNSGTIIPINLKDSYYTHGIANPKNTWKTSINPFHDKWDSVLLMLPNGLHNFKYHFKDTNRQWFFDFEHRDLRFIDEAGSGSVNHRVPAQIIEYAKQDMAAGRKNHFGSEEAPDEYAMSMGEWGATYHYTVTVSNTSDHDRKVTVQTWDAENLIFGLKEQGQSAYATAYYRKIGNTPDSPEPTATIDIPANTTKTFEFVTMLAAGLSGLNHAIVVE